MDKEKQNSHLPLPSMLRELMASGRWRQPLDADIHAMIPFLCEPVDFLLSESRIRSESGGQCVNNPHMRDYRGSESAELSLPWRDTDLSLLIAVNREIGADLGIALDYRTSYDNPRIIASDWWVGDHTLYWREAFPTFSDFIVALRL